MNANGYLTRLADMAIIRDDEKESIRRSVSVLGDRLRAHFGDEIEAQDIFGSYSRGTILPRSMDQHSDVDYLIVFKSRSAKPQTYLDRLRRFTEINYARSEIGQSHPTIVLELNHIRFDLVPATKGFFGGLGIPVKKSLWGNWQSTNPWDFQKILAAKNKANAGYIRKLIRIMKYWNVLSGFPFESFDLETRIVSKGYFPVSPIFGVEWNLLRYFRDFADGLGNSLTGDTPKWIQSVGVDLRTAITETQRATNSGDHRRAVKLLRDLLPDPTESAIL